MTEYYLPKPEILSRIPDNRHAVIEASAGTGKTFTIEHIFVDLILTKDVSIEEILVLTFTEKAASELRARVRSILERAVSSRTDVKPAEGEYWTIGEKEQIKLERSLFAFDLAPIHTIHGFFQRVISEHAFSGGRLFDQTLTDGRSFFTAEFRKELRENFARDPETGKYLSFWLEQMELPVGDLEDLLYECHKKKCELRPIVNAGELESEIRSLAGQIADPAALGRLEGSCRANKVNARTIGALMERMRVLKQATDDFLKEADLLSFLKQAGDVGGAYICEKMVKARPCDALTGTLIDSVLKLPCLLISPKAVIAQKFIAFMNVRVASEKKKQGCYDFDDMIMSLWEGIEGPQGADLLRALRSRYRYALVDESQDTDEYQWKIFKRLFLESGGQNIIYLIGDPKQAIYGFRGADVYTYLDAKNDICKSEPAIPLSENFRSTQDLVDAFNTIFDQTVQKPFFDGGIRYDLPVACGRKDFVAVDAHMNRIAPVKVVLVRPDGKSVSAGQFRQKMGRYIAGEIGRILGGRAAIRSGVGGGLRPVTAGDIFILTRKESEGTEVSEHLRKAGIPFSFYKQEGLFQTREAEQIRDLLAAVEDPHNQSKRFKAWMTPFFNISLEQLISCRDLPETEYIVKLLMEWHSLAAKRRYQELFSLILRQSGLIRREIFFRQHERQLTNFLHILEILLEEVNIAVCDISELVSALNGFIKETRSPARENGNVQRLETEKEAVQIMTMHKSKGLEAEVVFVFGGITAFPGVEINAFHENGRRVLYIGKMPADIEGRFSSEMRLEDQRLLYVASTRAKARLYLPYISPGDMGPGLNGPYIQMIERLDNIMQARSRLFEIEDAEIHRFSPGETAGEAEVRVFSGWDPPKFCLDDDNGSKGFEELRRGHAGFEVTSYSRLKNKKEKMTINLEEREDAEEVSQPAADAADEEYIGGADFGSALHKILEKVPFSSFGSGKVSLDEWCSLEEITDISKEALLANGIDPRFLRYSQKLVFNALASEVSIDEAATIPGLNTVGMSLREVEFLYPYPEESHPRLSGLPAEGFRIDRGFVKGFIDFIFEFEGKTFFADWKTDTLRDYLAQTLKKHFEDHYLLQIKLYLIAIAKMLRLYSKSEYDARFGGVLYCFVRGMKPGGDGIDGIFFVRPSWEDLLSYEEELLMSEDYMGGATYA